MLQDGLADRWHSEHWNQLVEDFFPLEVSQLFFFDAEKIRSLAEDETSSQVLGTAVKCLLGLDIAERLISDAGVLEARLAKELEAVRPREDRADLEKEVEQLRVELDGLRTKRSELENIRRRTEAEEQRLDEEFKAAGGRHWEARGDRKRRQEELKNEVNDCETRIVSLSATELPLRLLDDLLDRVERQDERERLAAEVEVVQQILMERDDHLLALLAEVKAPSGILQKVKKHLSHDRQSRTLSAEEIVPRLSLTADARSLLLHLRSQKLADLRGEAETLLERRLQLDRKIKDVDRVLSITSEDEGIGAFLKRLRATTERLTTLNAEAKQLDRLIAERKTVCEDRRAGSRESASERRKKSSPRMIGSV